MSELKTAREILGTLNPDVVAVTYNGRVVDLHTPIAATAQELTTVTASSPAGLRVIRHSTAHIMADAVQKLYPGTKVTIGPAIEDGFYYDFEKAGAPFTDEDLGAIEKVMREISKSNAWFKRSTVTRAEALKTFTDMGEHFKVDIINSIPEGEEISLYTHGRPGSEWFDVCEGPHVPSTGMLKAVKLTHVAGAYWRGDERNPMLQRVYGTAFDTKEALDEHLKQIEEAKARDHRKLGKELELFMFDQVAPAMPFFLPKGAFVYNQMVSYVREMYDQSGYDEVITPQIFNPNLFRTSGHLGNYNENMYRLWTEDELHEAAEIDIAIALGEKKEADFRKKMQEQSFALKPMNCPSHCVIFGSKKRSYRDLPWRLADFGRLHRYERGGVVHGLSRVRTFCQDDAHIFCAEDSVSKEIEDFIASLYKVYNTFRFENIDIKLATRPDKRIGSDAEWDLAEGALEKGLKAAGLPYSMLPGEGAFYGPKLEFHVQDALKRSWQLGTIQYDPNLPERFELAYTGSDGKDHRPVMLHRAILGSLERFFSVYLEHSGGNFPVWLAPKQVSVVTVSEKADDYAYRVAATLKARGVRVDLDVSADKLGAKIRNARLSRVPYIAVIGAQEAETDTLGVRSRERGELGSMSLASFGDMVTEEAAKRG